MKRIKQFFRSLFDKLDYEEVIDDMEVILISCVIIFDLFANLLFPHTDYEFHMASMIWFFGTMALIGIYRNNE